MDDDGMDEKEEEDDDDDAGSVSASTPRFSPGDNVSMIASFEALINSSGVPPEAIMNQLGTNDMVIVAAVRSASQKLLTVERVAGDMVHVRVIGSVGLSRFALPAGVLEPVSDYICMQIWSLIPSAIFVGLILARATPSSVIAVCDTWC
jgi:hypothetical protein